MSKTCLKCGYEKQLTDISPEYECPQCGAIYAKVEAKVKQQQLTSSSPREAQPSAKSSNRTFIEILRRKPTNKDIPYIMFFAGAFLSLGIWLSLQSELELEAKALEVCKAEVKYKSKFPTKLFFDESEPTVNIGMGDIFVSGRVELMNGLGNMIPHKYRCMVNPDTLKLRIFDLTPG